MTQPGSNRHVAFRVDASLDIGTGHVMRCLTLADALHRRGVHCTFICRDLQGNLAERIRQHGFDVHLLGVTESVTGNDEPLPAHAGWLGTGWQHDAAQTVAALGELKPEWLVVDHYALDTRWEQQLRSHCEKIMVIDDLADRQHDCDVLLDQNLGRESSDYADHVATNCRLLIGTRFALLRREFADARPRALNRRKHARLRRILVTMGGVDKDNATGKVLDALQLCELPDDVEIVVISGSAAPHLDAVREQARNMPVKTTVRTAIDNMAEEMILADIAVGAAGSTSWERCCLGLPSLLVVLADNQQVIATALDKVGAAVQIGKADDISTRLPQAMQRVNDSSLLQQMSGNAQALVDGAGCERVLDIMLGKESGNA
jgi:UDP-2,4-diacetamido-2,4,6-trideoxy-beta-L-altropyranose hydrolase